MQYRVDCSLRVKAVEHRLNHENVGAAVNKTASSSVVIFNQLVEIDIAGAGIVYIRRYRRGTWGRSNHSSYKARFVWVLGGFRIRDFAGQGGAGAIKLFRNVAQLVIVLGYDGGVKGIGLDNVGARVEIGLVDFANNIWPSQC